MLVFQVIFVIILVFLIQYLKNFLANSKTKLKKAPGPWGVPIFGSAIALGAAPHLTFTKWAKKYGPVVACKFGTQKVIVINDAQILRETFSQPALIGRPDNKTMTIFSEGKHGIASSNGSTWIEQRRFTLRALRDFGFDKHSMEVLIKEEVQEVLNWITERNENPAAIDTRLSAASVNSLWRIISGERHEQGNTEVTDTLAKLNDILESIFRKNLILFLFPKLIEILPKFLLSVWYKSVEEIKPLSNIFKKTIQNHANNHEVIDHPNDFIDMYINEIKACADPKSSFYKNKGYEHLFGAVSDLHSAGQATTSITLNWAILYLLRFPRVQSILQSELDEVVGPNRLPTLADRPNLPYTEAFIQETFRMSSITPMGVFRTTVADTTIGGYNVPKNTQAIGNFYGIHHSPEIWGDPEVFRPERFLSKDGQTINRSKNLMAFGVGKRVCIGESLARDSTFLFVASIAQQFQILPDPSGPTPTLAPRFGLVLEPVRYQAVFKHRLVI